MTAPSRVGDDGEAAAERRQRAHRVQPALRQRQALRDAGEVRAHRVREAGAQLLLVRAVLAHRVARRAARQPRAHSARRTCWRCRRPCIAPRRRSARSSRRCTCWLRRTPGCASRSRRSVFSRRAPQAAQFAAHAPARRCARAPERLQAGEAVGHDQLGGRRGRRRARIGDEVGDGEVHLVADAADDRQRAGMDRARQLLVVEGPQVLERAAAARQDEHVAFGARRGQLRARAPAPGPRPRPAPGPDR